LKWDISKLEFIYFHIVPKTTDFLIEVVPFKNCSQTHMKLIYHGVVHARDGIETGPFSQKLVSGTLFPSLGPDHLSMFICSGSINSYQNVP